MTAPRLDNQHVPNPRSTLFASPAAYAQAPPRAADQAQPSPARGAHHADWRIIFCVAGCWGFGVGKTTVAGLALACAWVAGCAGIARMPADFELRHATLVTGTASPELSLDGPQSKGSGAATGAAKGGGMGFLIGGLACMGTGPLAPLCLATLVPAGLGIGALSGAAVGSITSESAEHIGVKRQLLAAELTRWMVRQPLAEQVQQKLQAAGSSPALSIEAAALPSSQRWQLNVALTELATIGNGPGVPFALQASATLEMARPGQPQPLFVKHYQATSANRMTTADWGANTALPLRTALDGLTQVLVAQMVNDLAGTAAHP